MIKVRNRALEMLPTVAKTNFDHRNIIRLAETDVRGKRSTWLAFGRVVAPLPFLPLICPCFTLWSAILVFFSQVFVDIAKTSPENLEKLSECGQLGKLVDEINKSDVLVRLNALELLAELSSSCHGLDYLERTGVLAKLRDKALSLSSDPLGNFLGPGKHWWWCYHFFIYKVNGWSGIVCCVCLTLV